MCLIRAALFSILAALYLLPTAPANAFTKLEWECHESQTDEACLKTGGLKSIFIYDEINSGDAQQFTMIDSQHPNQTPFPPVFINSRGGEVAAAMTIGRILRRRKASIEGRDLFFPDHPAMCDSACPMLAAGAVTRQFAEIGLHRPFLTSRDTACKPITRHLSDEGLTPDLQYFAEMGLPKKFFQYVKNTPSDKMAEFYYDPKAPSAAQLIVQFGFRMKRNARLEPAMFDTKGEPRFIDGISILERGVREGNAAAAYKLGRIFMDGSGQISPDIKKAIAWHEKSAKLGSYKAVHDLGVIFSNGNGVEEDKRKAVSYYRQASEMGFAGSQNNLGWAYYKGEGIEQNLALAIYWITRAIDQGEPFAYSSLGEMRLHSHGFPPDDVDAYRWLRLADKTMPRGTSRENNSARLKVLEARMSADDILRGDALAQAWYPLKQTAERMASKCAG